MSDRQDLSSRQCLAVPGRRRNGLLRRRWTGRPTTHAVCVIDQAGAVRWRGTVAHSADGLAEFIAPAAPFRPRPRCRIAIERPSGLRGRRSDGGGPPGRGHPSERRQGLSAALPRRRRQERSGRRLSPRRPAAHRRPSLPRRCSPARTRSGPCAPWCGAATTSSPSGSRWPTGCAALLERLLARRRRRSSPTSIRPIAWPSWRATRPPRAPRGSARSAWPQFLAQHALLRPPLARRAARPPARRPRRPGRREGGRDQAASSSAPWSRC